MKKKNIILALLPVLFGFFIMGFVDVVGIATSYVKEEFGLSEQMSGFLPSMVFIWFLLFSIPFAGVMNKIGRKNTVLLSLFVTFIGMMMPILSGTLNMTVCFIAFALLGIGNAILQVSLFPLLSNIVQGKQLTGSITAGQVLKALSSFFGPFIALFAINTWGNWSYIFPVFGTVTIIAALWLMFVPIEKESQTESTSMTDALQTLKNSKILLFFIGIMVVVGIDVGVNMLAPKLLVERLGLTTGDKVVQLASSIYFACRTIGAFIGAALLMKVNPMKYFRIHIVVGMLALTGLLFVKDQLLILCLIGIAGYGFSSIFAIIFSLAMQTLPQKANTISGLMVTAIVGGALVPPIMTFVTSLMNGNQSGAVLVLVLITLFLLYLSFSKQTKQIAQ
ncbi:MAG: MFS transporter [Bacteroidales bacterium]|jgi:fucose permease|nr:MFS transporter [Bacteroidales bacterium]